MLAKSKLNSIETLVSQALIDWSQEYVKNVSEKQESMRLNSFDSNKITSL